MITQLYPAVILGACCVSALSCATQLHMRVCVCVCGSEQEDRLDDPLSPGDCVEPASRGEAAITTSWALSGRWPTLYSTRPASLTDGRMDGQWDRRADRRNTQHVNMLTLGSDLRKKLISLPNSWKQEKAVGVIGLLQHRSRVNGLIWGLTPFKTNLRLCVIVPLTKFLTWSVQRFIVLLKETCCPAKGHLMVFQTHSVTLMYCRSKDKAPTCADEREKSREDLRFSLWEVHLGAHCYKWLQSRKRLKGS